MCMKERLIIIFGFIFGLFSFKTLSKAPSIKIWLPLYIMNCLVNYIFDKSLVKANKVKYPVRLLPKYTKINVVYDFLVCPFLSVWFCQSTYNSDLKGIISKTFLFGLPQGIYEVLLEKKTDSLKFKGGWHWIYSVLLVLVVKIISRVMLSIIKKLGKGQY
jgi:hypothetical protein